MPQLSEKAHAAATTQLDLIDVETPVAVLVKLQDDILAQVG